MYMYMSARAFFLLSVKWILANSNISHTGVWKNHLSTSDSAVKEILSQLTNSIFPEINVWGVKQEGMPLANIYSI